MGTRNLTMVVSNGKTKVAQYGQWDGYPEGQGKTILSLLKRIDAASEWARFKDKIDNLNWLTEMQSKKVDKDKNWDINYPYLSRDAGGEIINAIHFGKMNVHADIGKKKEIDVKIIGLTNGEDFASDSLFCEWAYVIDLDKETFEVYKGFNTSPLESTERFYDEHFKPDESEVIKERYYPIKFLKSYALNKLPKEKDFIKECTPVEEETES